MRLADSDTALSRTSYHHVGDTLTFHQPFKVPRGSQYPWKTPKSNQHCQQTANGAQRWHRNKEYA
jgi:hypothetical protein